MASKDLSKRAEALRRVTDLFVLGSDRFTEDDVGLFGDVMSKLVEGIELAARAAFGSRIARMSGAPPKVVRILAFDDAVEVAAPVLAHSDQLDDEALVENARTKSQGHLLAISGRQTLVAAVTDVLVDRGNQLVLTGTAKNAGAAFSDFGFSTPVRKSHDDASLAMCIWSRPDIPRRDLVRLFVQATEAVRSKLEAAHPRRAGLIRAAVAEASNEVQTLARAGSHEAAQALSSVQLMQASGRLNEARLLEFAQVKSFDKTTVAHMLPASLVCASSNSFCSAFKRGTRGLRSMSSLKSNPLPESHFVPSGVDLSVVLLSGYLPTKEPPGTSTATMNQSKHNAAAYYPSGNAN